MDQSRLLPPMLVFFTISFEIVGRASAQEAGPGHVPPAAPAPAGDPRAGPRLVYTRGPVDCLTEAQFRDEVAVVLDGVDHLRAAAPDVVTVTFEKAVGGFRSTWQYTDAQGRKEPLIIKVYSQCEILGRWVASSVSATIPPPPPPRPSLDCDPCAAAVHAEEAIEALRRGLEEERRRYGRWSNEQDRRIEDLEARNAALQLALNEAKKNRMDLTGLISAGVIMTANLTSNVGPAIYVGGEARSGPLSLGLDARFVIPAPVSVATTKAGEILDYDLSQIVGLLTPCGHYSYFFGCGVAGAGAQTAIDTNFTAVPFGGTRPIVQLGGRLGAEVMFGESLFGLRLWGEVLYSTPAAGFDYKIIHTNGIEAYSQTQPDVSAFFGLGLVVKVAGNGAR